MKVIIAIACVIAAASAVSAAHSWAVIVAGSSTWSNYRHQADACHAYQIVRRNGIPAERIIIMHYDDIANNPSNPFPGQVFNKPTAAGVPGVDVYAGCGKDYTGSAVTPQNFIAVLTGNAQAVANIPNSNGKVLRSTADDNVFIYFTDHGGPNLIAFPHGTLSSSQLNSALKTMNEKKMYKKLVFYLEACESGSMFNTLLPTNINVYATTAANPTESSWGFYCPPDDSVNGKHMRSCLGDEYSIQWMEDSDAKGPMETLAAQFNTVKTMTKKSHVQQYGDVSWTSLNIGQFQGERFNESSPFVGRLDESSAAPAAAAPRPSSAVSSRDIPMHLAYYDYLRADKSDLVAAHAAARDLLKHVEQRIATDNFFVKLAGSVVGESSAMGFVARASIDASECACCERMNAIYDQQCGGWNDYSRAYMRVINNLCAVSPNMVGYESMLGDRITAMCK